MLHRGAAAGNRSSTPRGGFGRVGAAADEPVRVGSPDMASEEAAQDSTAPRPSSTISDRELAERLSETQRVVTVTGGQLDAK